MATNAAGEINVISPKFKWVIDNSCLTCKNVGDFLTSPIFTIISANRNIQCWLQLYPKGSEEEYKNYFSLYVNVDAKIRANVTFEILNRKGNSVLTQTMPKMMFNRNRWGFPYYVNRQFIINSANDILNNNKITIVCICEVIEPCLEDKKVTEESRSEEEEEEEEADKLLQRLAELDKYEALINEDKFSDISLISEGKAIKVHKCILAKSSPVFSAMFNIDMEEKHNNTVEITDIKHNILVEMIRFMYIGQVNDIDEIASELVGAADKYDMDNLKKMCEKTMCKNLNVENVLLYLELADTYGLDEMKKKGVDFIVAHAEDVTGKPVFEYLSSVLLSEICRALVMKYK